SPLAVDDIGSMGPIGFADWLDEDPSRTSEPYVPIAVADPLRTAVASDAGPWITELEALSGRLRHPTLMAAVVGGIRQAASAGMLEIDWSRIVGLAELQTEALESGPASWHDAPLAVVDLLKWGLDEDRLALELLPRVHAALRSIVIEPSLATDAGPEVADVDGESLFSEAINSLPMRALEADYALFLFSHRAGDPAPWAEAFTALLEETLVRDDRAGRLAPHLVAPLLAQYLHFHPSAGHLLNAVLGNPVADELNSGVLATLVRFGSPQNGAFLRLIREHLVAFLLKGREEDDRTRERAATWVVYGYVWQVANFPLDDVLSVLQEAGHLGIGIEQYGRALMGSKTLKPENIAVALEFWDRALGLPDESAAGLAGFGWWTETLIPDSEWLSRISRTLERTGGTIGWGHEVARRCATLAVSEEEALVTLQRLARGAENQWAVARWRDHFVRALEVSAGVQELYSARRELIEVLLDRGEYDFRSYLDEPGS
ncbi:MAG: hypothetical protein KJ956_09440, partial [Actinobacteria bacterium]|nr:hypothetical protein [Actinomycetota bacterium]